VCICVSVLALCVCKMHFGIVLCVLAQWFIIWVCHPFFPKAALSFLPINSESVTTRGRQRERKRKRKRERHSQDIHCLNPRVKCSAIFLSKMWLVNFALLFSFDFRSCFSSYRSLALPLMPFIYAIACMLFSYFLPPSTLHCFAVPITTVG